MIQADLSACWTVWRNGRAIAHSGSKINADWYAAYFGDCEVRPYQIPSKHAEQAV
jgi:hypothetical protein